MLGPGPGLGGVVTHIWLIIAIYEPGGRGSVYLSRGTGARLGVCIRPPTPHTRHKIKIIGVCVY